LVEFNQIYHAAIVFEMGLIAAPAYPYATLPIPLQYLYNKLLGLVNKQLCVTIQREIRII
jgi:hypothetical protein